MWHSYDIDNVWLPFDALKVTHVHSRQIGPHDWDMLFRLGFPVYLYEVASLAMVRLEGGQEARICQAHPLSSSASKTGAMETRKTASANAASSNDTSDAGADPWKHIPLPSSADASDCLNSASALRHSIKNMHELPVGDGAIGVTIMRTLISQQDSARA